MGDSTEEMLNVTVKRLGAIMHKFSEEEALAAEVYNLIDAAIVILKSSSEEIDANKAAGYWEELRGYAKRLYIESVTMHHSTPRAGQFHLSGKLMTMICLCKNEKERIEQLEKETGADEPRQQRKTMKYRCGRPYFDFE